MKTFRRISIFGLCIFLVIYFYVGSFEHNSDIVAVGDSSTLEESNNSPDDDYVLEDAITVLGDKNVELTDNLLLFKEPNNLMNDSNIEFLKNLFGLAEREKIDILNYDNSEVICSSNDSCYFGTGMKLSFTKRASVTDNVDDTESNEEFENNFNNPEYEDDTTVSDNDSNELENYKEEKSIYYIIVVGDITGDGKIEINDIVKLKNKINLDFNNSDSVTDLNFLYKKALNLYESETGSNFELDYTLLSNFLVRRIKISNLIKKESSQVSITEEETTIGVSDCYKLNVETENIANVVFSSSDEKIAIVDENGVVTARKTGEVTITATVGENTDSCKIKVIIAPERVSFKDNIVNLVIGNTYQNKVYIFPSEVSDNTIVYSSSNESVATVDSNGIVTALSEGECFITGTTVNGKQESYLVNVLKEEETSLSAINVSEEIGTLNMSNNIDTNDTVVDGTVLLGSTFKLEATSKYFNDSEAMINWESSDESIATIDSTNGKVTTHKTGTVTFYVTSGAKIKSYTVNVYETILGSKELKLDMNQSISVAIRVIDFKKNDVDVELSNLVIDSSEFYQSTISKNKIGFTGVKELNSPIDCHIKVNNLEIGSISIAVVDPSNKSNAQAIFLPTQYKTEVNESILLKSADGSLALIDTASKDSNICKKIVRYIHKYAGVKDTEYVTLKYLIVSHSHSDHVGCLSYLVEKSYSPTTYLKINKIIMKDERMASPYSNYSGSKTYSNVYNYVKANKKQETALVKVNGLNDNYTIKLGSGDKAMKLHLFNLADTFASEAKCKTSSGGNAYGKSIQFAYDNGKSKYNFIKVRGKNSSGSPTTYYPYLKYANSTNVQFSTTKKVNQYNGNIPMYFYAYDPGSTKVCNSNANSIAVLAEVPIENNDVRYIYLPSDIENNGYPLNGRVVTVEGKKLTVYGPGSSYFYKYSSNKFEIKDNALVPDTGKIVRRAREFKTALAISKAFDINKIVVYQGSHHNINNDKATIDLLNLNRKNVYVVSLRKSIQKNMLKSYHINSYYYTLSNVTSTKNRFYTSGLYYDSTDVNGTLEFSILNNGKVDVNAIKAS